MQMGALCMTSHRSGAACNKTEERCWSRISFDFKIMGRREPRAALYVSRASVLTWGQFCLLYHNVFCTLSWHQLFQSFTLSLHQPVKKIAVIRWPNTYLTCSHSPQRIAYKIHSKHYLVLDGLRSCELHCSLSSHDNHWHKNWHDSTYRLALRLNHTSHRDLYI